MVKIMNTNRIVTISTAIALILIISIPTIYKVNKNHNNNLYKAVNKQIIESAEKCYYDEICLDEKIYLKTLYELNRLEKVSDPLTKEYYNDESYVQKSNKGFEFIIVP